MRRTSRIYLLLAVVLALAGGILMAKMVRPEKDATWERLQGGGQLRVAVDPSFPPFDDVNAQGEITGFDIDLASALAQRLGTSPEFIVIAFDGLVDAVLAGKADVVISAFPLDQRLSEDVRYSQPYFDAGLVWVTRAESGLTDPQQLAQTTVAVEWGSQGDAWARAQKLPRVVRYETPDATLAAVLAQEADAAAIVDAVSAGLFPQPGLMIHTPPLTSDPYVIVMPKDAPKLAAAVDAALAEIIAEGEWTRLAEKYFSYPPPQPSNSLNDSQKAP